MSMDSEHLLRAVADKTRQRVLSIIGRHELSVSELVEVLNQPQSTVSRHLKVLREVDLIVDRRNGHAVHYRLKVRAADSADSDGGELAGRLLDWVNGLPIDGPIALRLDRVIAKREAMSRSFFDRVGRDWDALREESFGAQFHLEAFIGLLPRDWVVLDVGSGTGFQLPTLGRHFARVIGVEPVGRMLDVARERVRASGLENVELTRGDLTELPVASAGVDLAIAALVIHHVSTPRDALAELARVVKPGGKVMLIEQCAHDNEAFRDRMQDRLWGFEPDEFRAMLLDQEFVDVATRRLWTVVGAADAPALFVATGTRGSSR